MLDAPQEILKQAIVMFAAGRLDAGEHLLRQASEQPAVRERLVDFLLAEGRRGDALNAVRGAGEPMDRAIEALIEGRAGEALAWCDGALKQHPQHVSARLARARCLHNLGRAAEALAEFEALSRTDSERPEIWLALAHARRASGQEAAACRAWEAGLERSPGLIQARFELGLTLLNLDRPGAARSAFEQLLDRRQDHVDAQVYLGLALHMLGQSELAVRRLKRALRQAPGHVEAHRFLASILNQSGQAAEARQHLEQALAARSDDPDLVAELADIHELSSELERAQALVARGLARAPGHPALTLLGARLARRRGDHQAARRALESLVATRLPARQALQQAHELGLVLDRLGEADEAIEAFERANALAGQDARARAVDRSAFPRQLDSISASLNGPVRPPEAGPDQGADLVFMVGFTRSGTTLLDSFLKPHPGLATTEERPTVERVIESLQNSGRSYPEDLVQLSSADWVALRQRYRDLLRPLIPAGWRGLVVDRMPLRMIHADFIRQLFPGARLLLVVRHPCDVVLSNFMQQFEPGEALIHCDSLASTVELYQRTQALWTKIEPRVAERLYVLRYESLVVDARRELGALCDWLELPFDPAMLERDARGRDRDRVRTASYQQVHEPLYERAAGRWQGYRRHLEPFFPMLAPYIRKLGYPEL